MLLSQLSYIQPKVQTFGLDRNKVLRKTILVKKMNFKVLRIRQNDTDQGDFGSEALLVTFRFFHSVFVIIWTEDQTRPWSHICKSRCTTFNFVTVLKVIFTSLINKHKIHIFKYVFSANLNDKNLQQTNRQNKDKRLACTGRLA